MPIDRGPERINYRSEPFGINNMHVQHEYFGFEDESMAYSSYTFGDAASDDSPELLRGSGQIPHCAWGLGSVPFASSAWGLDPVATQPTGHANAGVEYGSKWAGEISRDPDQIRPGGRGSHRALRSLGPGNRMWVRLVPMVGGGLSCSIAMWRITMSRGCGATGGCITPCRCPGCKMM